MANRIDARSRTSYPQDFMAEVDPKIDFSPELAARLQKALSATGGQLFQWVRDPDPAILHVLLKNPRLEEEHLLALLQRTDLKEGFLKSVYRRPETAKSRRLKRALLKNPCLPPWMIQSLLPEMYLFELVDLCLLPGISQDLKLAAERTVLSRLAAIPLGSKITLARRGTSAMVGELLQEGEERLMEACLANPRLREVAVLKFLSGSRSDPDAISRIARHPRWKDRRNLRLAILKNPRTPDIWFTLFLPALPNSDLQSLLVSGRLAHRQKSHVENELARRRQG